MNNFTNGNWGYEEYIPDDITINGKEFVVAADGKDIALVKNEFDARLITAAPDMYQLLEKLLKVLFIHYEENCVQEIINLLNFIDGHIQEGD